MLEKQNEEKVTLVSIRDEIKSMREEAKMRHKEALIVSGVGVAGAICFLSISIWVTTMLSPNWQWFDSLFFGLIGLGFLIHFKRMGEKLRKEQRETHRETENSCWMD